MSTIVLPTPTEIEGISGGSGPRDKFIALLIDLYPAAKGLLTVLKEPLATVARKTSLHCFMATATGEKVDILRRQMAYHEKHGEFDFETRVGWYTYETVMDDVYLIPHEVVEITQGIIHTFTQPGMPILQREGLVSGDRILVFKGFGQGWSLASVRKGDNGDIYAETRSTLHTLIFQGKPARWVSGMTFTKAAVQALSL